MYKVQKPKSQGYLLEVMKGLGVTMRHMVKNLTPGASDIATISYPEQRRKYSERFRGMHILTRHENGDPKCVACYMCQTACPADCITIVAEEHEDPSIEKRPKSFQIDTMRCIFCGLCVDACPKEALIMSRDYELATMTRQDAIYEINDLMARRELSRENLGYRPCYDEKDASGKPVFVGPGGKAAFKPVYCNIYGQEDVGKLNYKVPKV